MKAYICTNCAFSTIIKNRFEKCPICNNELTQLTNKENKIFLNLNGDQRIQWIENKIGHSIPEELNELRENYKQNKIQEISQKNEQQARNYKRTNDNYYCKKCGRVVHRIAYKTGYIDDTCDYCKSKVFPVPEKYWTDDRSPLITNEQIELLREELVKTAPEFDQYLFEHRDHDLAERTAKIDAALEHGKAILEEQNRRVKCTYCGSTNVKKIGLLNRAVSTELWGLGSKKIGKQFHCNNCGADF